MIAGKITIYFQSILKRECSKVYELQDSLNVRSGTRPLGLIIL